jgi:YebC/PmpR family DNA-binding regulatory protein
MSGHSHWATIKRKKEATDAKKGKLFSKIAKDIFIAVRDGGADLAANAKLQSIIEKAREVGMPKTNVERAVQKASGTGDKSAMIELVFEGYGPGGVAILVETISDNRNRTSAEFRKLFENRGGKLGASGSVAYLFDKKGLIVVPCAGVSEDKLTEIILDAGAEDLKQAGDFFEVTCKLAAFGKVKQAIKDANIPIESADITQIPQNTVAVDENIGRKILDMIEKFEDHDDTQNVYANYELPESLLAELEKEA